MNKVLKIKTEFLEFEISKINYDKYYKTDKESNSKYLVIENIKIINGDIYFNYNKIEKFLKKYLGNKCNIDLFWEFWRWFSEYNESINIDEGEIKYLNLEFNEFTIECFYEAEEIEYNIYPFIGTYIIVGDILREIVLKTIEILEKDILRDFILSDCCPEYFNVDEFYEQDKFGYYKIKIPIEKFNIKKLLSKYLNYNKIADNISKIIKMNLKDLLQRDEFLELIQNYFSENEFSNVTTFIEEVSEHISFWNKFYSEFYNYLIEEYSELKDVLTKDNIIYYFIISKIHNDVEEIIKSKLSPFAI
ncbi:MAG: hypothetical protein ACO2O4_01170 [Minisyncoccia bacterium]|jgi:hypothetical protein